MFKRFTTIIQTALIVGALVQSTFALALAEGGARIPDINSQSNIQIVLSKQPDSAIRLEVRQAPLGQILKAIADKTSAIIHYSVLPEAPVTATCVGANVGQVMDCLVAKQVGLVAHKAQQNKPAEFWLLGSSVGSCQAVTVFSNTQYVQPNTIFPAGQDELSNVSPEKQKKLDALLEKLRQANTSEEKAQVLSDLATVGVIEDPNVRKAIADASMSLDASIRTQAVITSAALDKDNASDILGNAMHDADPAVRMAALDMAIDNVKVLEQAMTDSDSSIRDLAAAKLSEIKNRQARLQQ
jgi:hypothetical protein